MLTTNFVIMNLFPASALSQLEFDKVRILLANHCNTVLAKAKANQLRIHTVKAYINQALNETEEFSSLIRAGLNFPNDFSRDISRELKLLGIPGAILLGEDFLLLIKLIENTGSVFRWFNNERKALYPALYSVISSTHYEKHLSEIIFEILDENGKVKDTASKHLAAIRLAVYQKRMALRTLFERSVAKYAKLGYLAEISESFMNGRRVLAVVAENKRMIRGVLHGESDTRRTAYIEPEETIDFNNAIFSLEYEESREVNKILQALTAKLHEYAPLLQQWFQIAGEYDFIAAKARLAIEMDGVKPILSPHPVIKLDNAFHPLLKLYNQQNGKVTVPVSLSLNNQQRILVISGPNAGGKTVTLKTVGLLQMMMQSGLLIPVGIHTELGIFKQIFIHIGDTQSLEFELSTYSAQLKNMKYFIEEGDGKTLFFIDELGSGSDPNLGGAFAEVILEEMEYKRSLGIVTTHYLNLKIMAGKRKGIINGAMQFDEKRLMPLYKLQIGKPGSSYTFAMAERIGLKRELIDRARKLADDEQYKLDKLLNKTEQGLQKINLEKQTLHTLIKENEELKAEMNVLMSREAHRQEVEKLKHQNKIAEEKLIYLKDMERKLKFMIMDWRKSEDKASVIKNIQTLLLGQKDKLFVSKKQKEVFEKYDEIGGDIRVGDMVKMKQNKQIGLVTEIRGKQAVLQVGKVPIISKITNLVVIREKNV